MLSVPSGVTGLIGVRPRVTRVHPVFGSPWGSSCSIGNVRFTRVRLSGVGGHSGWLCSLGCAWGSSGSFGVVGFLQVRPGGSPVNSRS